MATTQTQTLQVTCINVAISSSGHEAITHLGGANWRWTKGEVIAELESPYPRYAFYTYDGVRYAWIRVRTGANGNKYVQTEADGRWTNNLLSLPICHNESVPKNKSER